MKPVHHGSGAAGVFGSMVTRVVVWQLPLRLLVSVMLPDASRQEAIE